MWTPDGKEASSVQVILTLAKMPFLAASSKAASPRKDKGHLDR